MRVQYRRLTDSADLDFLETIRHSYPAREEDLANTLVRHQHELSETANHRIFIGTSSDGQIVGYGQLILRNADNDPELADGESVAHIHDLRIRSDLQGLGYGSHFIAFLESQARELGMKAVTIGVDDSNGRALQLYRRLGYEKFKETEGRTPDERLLYMRRKLPALS